MDFDNVRDTFSNVDVEVELEGPNYMGKVQLMQLFRGVQVVLRCLKCLHNLFMSKMHKSG